MGDAPAWTPWALIAVGAYFASGVAIAILTGFPSKPWAQQQYRGFAVGCAGLVIMGWGTVWLMAARRRRVLRSFGDASPK